MDLLKKPDLEARIARVYSRLILFDEPDLFRLWAEKARKRWKNRAFAGFQCGSPAKRASMG